MADEFCALLKEAIADESKAPLDYEKLKDSLWNTKKNPSDIILKRLEIDDIIKDERKHKSMLTKINREFC